MSDREVLIETLKFIHARSKNRLLLGQRDTVIEAEIEDVLTEVGVLSPPQPSQSVGGSHQAQAQPPSKGLPSRHER